MPPLQFLVIAFLCLHTSSGQSNYADQANNVEYSGEGLPEHTVLDGKVTKLDDLSPMIFLNRTKAVLNCAAGSMQVDLKFNDKFHGIAYANFDRSSACQILGNGGYSYKLELPLKGCGTKQSPQRVFTNNVVVRFHRGLEIDGDEVITIVCRYPPPVAPVPPAPPAPRLEEPQTGTVLGRPLNSFQILLIICGILFLSLLLLGLGCSYYCLRNRRIAVVRKLPFSDGSGSDITKLTSSVGNLSMFEGLKIPRAHAPVQAIASSSSSDGHLISDTLPSDYPSESHSESEELYTRSLPVSSAGSVYSEGYQERHIAPTTMVPRLPMAIKEQPPKFDVQVRVSKSPPSPPSLSISDTESSVSRNLTTIVEESPKIEKMQFTYIPELHHPPRHVQPAPTFNRILKRQQELHQAVEHEELKRAAPIPPPPPPVVPTHRPEITSHMVDDVFYKTITEKKTIEDIERHKRSITEYHTRPADVQKWDVTIRNYPVEMPEPPEWENFSDISSASGLTLPSIPDKPPIPPTNIIRDNKLPLNSPELVGNIGQVTHMERERILSSFNIPLENPRVPNWNVLIRVFEPTEQEGPVIENAETFNSQLTVADKIKWRQIITTESTLRSMLTEAVVREDFERIRHDTRYETLFEPPKWDVIIRILAPNDKQKSRFKKKGEWDTRSRRSSLPTLYEYDSDGGSSVRTLIREPVDLAPLRSRRTSRSSYRSEADLRSMSEMTVDFGRPSYSDYRSRYDEDSEPEIEYKTGSSSHHPSLARSLSQPSLARSASEFTEHWIAPPRYDTASEFTSPEGTPKSQRSTRIYPLHVPRGSPPGPGHSSGWQQASASSSQVVTHVPGGGTAHAQVVTREARTESRYVGRSSQDWFRDNDSDTKF